MSREKNSMGDIAMLSLGRLFATQKKSFPNCPLKTTLLSVFKKNNKQKSLPPFMAKKHWCVFEMSLPPLHFSFLFVRVALARDSGRVATKLENRMLQNLIEPFGLEWKSL